MNKLKQTLLVWLLQDLKPGYLPEPIFFQMCRLSTLTSVEVLLRYRGKVYLKLRDDKYFNKVWHIPGTMVRGDENLKQALGRLMKEELPEFTVKKSKWVTYFKETVRGNINHILWIYDIEKPLNIKEYKRLRALPNNLLSYHREVLKEI